MDDVKKNLKGSPMGDLFRMMHKTINKQFYMIDADGVLCSKFPPGIVAYIDYKKPSEPITFAEAIVYNEWVQFHPVFIIKATDPEHGPFTVMEYVSAEWKPNPPIVTWGRTWNLLDWKMYEDWERWLRDTYKRKKA